MKIILYGRRMIDRFLAENINSRNIETSIRDCGDLFIFECSRIMVKIIKDDMVDQNPAYKTKSKSMVLLIIVDNFGNSYYLTSKPLSDRDDKPKRVVDKILASILKGQIIFYEDNIMNTEFEDMLSENSIDSIEF